MFVKRLNSEMIEKFSERLGNLQDPNKHWYTSYLSLNTNDSVRVYLTDGYNMENTILIEMMDFHVNIWRCGKLSVETIVKEFIAFMRHIYGNEYKNAYMNYVAELLEDEGE